MSDAQFERLYKLLKLCEKKKIDTGLRHRIAIEVAHAGNIDRQLQTYEKAVKDGIIPATIGIPRKITLLSDSQGYGPRPEDDDEVAQRVTVNDRGDVHITYYNFTDTTLRRERFYIGPVEAIELIQSINTTFAIRVEESFATDVGSWELKITNTEGQTFSFNGSLFPDWQSPLANLSENLRDALNRPMLFGFDGQAEEKYQFVSVCFEFGGKEYCYLADDRNLAVGDMVEVPVGDSDRKTTATIVAIEYGTEDDAPYPVEDTKYIIRKIEPNLPEDLTGSPYEIVKCVVDALDPEGLLDMDAPQDEYDGESSAIAEAIRPSMNARQIAKIMADEFSSSFSDHFDLNYFMVAAARIKEALEKE